MNVGLHKEEYMKKYVCSTLLLISMNTIASSTFTSLCVKEESIGYSWKNNKWEITKFNLDKYLVEKVSPQDRFCQVKMQSVDTATVYQGEDKSGVKYYATKGCYNIRRMGQPRYEFNTEICSEYWKKKQNGQEELYMVGCTYSNFEPNGDFTMGRISDDLRNDQEYKDSMSLSVGKCSTIK